MRHKRLDIRINLKKKKKKQTNKIIKQMKKEAKISCEIPLQIQI